MKYFFFDIDGTLAVGNTGIIPKNTKRAVKLLQKNGHFVAIATGRLYINAINYCKDLGINNLVSDGGSGVTINGKLIGVEPLDYNLCINLLEELDEKGIAWSINYNDECVRYCNREQFMKEIEAKEKVKVLLAQSLFGNPDVLLLDEPTNDLDMKSINWLQDFLIDFENTVIVVSHDRYFLNKVCTHIADIDYSRIQLYVGNYDFWYEYSQMQIQQAKDQNKKAEAKKKELEEFIARFSANASKAKQATSRKKLLDNLEMVDIKPSLRRYPFIGFKPGREVGNIVLNVEGLTKVVDGEKLINNVSFSIQPNEKVAFVGDDKATEAFFKIIMGEDEDYEGEFKWGITTSQSYFPKDNSKYFNDCELSLVDWLRQFTDGNVYEQDLRGWLGRVLFSGEEALKKANVLSGGEKVRCMLAKMMMEDANVLVFDEPTNHLDLESIQALNQGLIQFKENILFTCHDHQFVQTIANRIIEFNKEGIIDRLSTYDEYLEYKEELENK